MTRTILAGVLAAASLTAQQPAAPPKPAAPAQAAPAQAAQPKGPQPKSQKELDALKVLFAAKDPDSVIKAAEALVTGFKDTDFKDLAWLMAADASQRKNDPEKALVYAERALEANKNNYQAMLMTAEILAQRTREHDFDREEKLNRAEKNARGAIDALKAAPKPNPNVTDEQWASSKQYLTAQAHQALGMSALTRKKYDVAITELKTAFEGVGSAEPAFGVRLAQAYLLAGKFDEAVQTTDKVLAVPNLHPQIKSVADQLKTSAVEAKAKGLKPATKPAGPQQVEIKQ